MIKINRRGALSKIDCPEAVEAKTPFEALSFLCATIPAFKKEFLASPYTIICDNDTLVSDQNLHACGCSSLTFYPIISGAAASAGVWMGVALAVASVAITVLTMPKIGSYEEREDPDSRNSFIFTGAKNTVEQGIARPLLYGAMEVGGHIISTGLTTERI